MDCYPYNGWKNGSISQFGMFGSNFPTNMVTPGFMSEYIIKILLIK